VRAQHLYVHVPFCARRCVYCDFSIAVRAKVPVAEYVASLKRELEVRHADSSFALETLYFGGGTPSKLGGDGVARVMDAIRARTTLSPGAEVTLEANPEDVDAATASAWMRAGINRVSLGVQSFDDAVLRWMHRTHDASRAVRAIEVLRDAGLTNVSIDLIFATPPEVQRSWLDDIGRAITLELPHLSIYGLTVEPHTPLGRWVDRATVREAPEDSFEREFLEANALATAAGLTHYEVSNYALPGMESRHNAAYWERAPYAGLGPSAHEFDGATRRWNVSPFAAWVEHLERGESPTEDSELLTESQRIQEQIYLGLRTRTGLPVDAVAADPMDRLLEAGWAGVEDRTLRLTPSGWLRLDSIANDLTVLPSRY
jgi:oxygen-independent coproporphyrinogen III oxidase